jgi:hypothetical protein
VPGSTWVWTKLYKFVATWRLWMRVVAVMAGFRGLKRGTEANGLGVESEGYSKAFECIFMPNGLIVHVSTA